MMKSCRSASSTRCASVWIGITAPVGLPGLHRYSSWQASQTAGRHRVEVRQVAAGRSRRRGSAGRPRPATRPLRRSGRRGSASPPGPAGCGRRRPARTRTGPRASRPPAGPGAPDRSLPSGNENRPAASPRRPSARSSIPGSSGRWPVPHPVRLRSACLMISGVGALGSPIDSAIGGFSAGRRPPSTRRAARKGRAGAVVQIGIHAKGTESGPPIIGRSGVSAKIAPVSPGRRGLARWRSMRQYCGKARAPADPRAAVRRGLLGAGLVPEPAARAGRHCRCMADPGLLWRRLLGADPFVRWPLRAMRRVPATSRSCCLAAGWTNVAFVLAVLEGEVLRVLLLFYLSPIWTVLLGRWLLRAADLAYRGHGGAGTGRRGRSCCGTAAGSRAVGPADLLAISAGFAFAINNVQTRRITTSGCGPRPGRLARRRPGLDRVRRRVGAAVAGGADLGLAGCRGARCRRLHAGDPRRDVRCDTHAGAALRGYHVVRTHRRCPSAWWLAGEAITANEWLGGAMILGAAMIAIMQRERRMKITDCIMSAWSSATPGARWTSIAACSASNPIRRVRRWIFPVPGSGSGIASCTCWRCPTRIRRGPSGAWRARPPHGGLGAATWTPSRPGWTAGRGRLHPSRSGRQALFCRDPDGNAWELIQSD
jgi:hypothetical protein